jgi:hypothetical protein
MNSFTGPLPRHRYLWIDSEADANEAFNALIQNRDCKNVMLYGITTQTTKTLRRY